MTRKTLTCPNGHRFPEPRVVYGYPTPEAMRDAEEGRIVLGGCDPTFPPENRVPGVRGASGVQSGVQSARSEAPGPLKGLI